MPEYKIETIGLGPVVDAFNRLIELGENPGPGLEAIGRILKTRMQLGFKSGTDPQGRPWALLKVRSGQPLRDKGRLMNSIDYAVEGNAVEIGTNVAYALTHQKGATIEAKRARALRFFVAGKPVFVRKVTIPPRPLVPEGSLPAAWAEDAVAAVQEVIERAIAGRQAGGGGVA